MDPTLEWIHILIRNGTGLGIFGIITYGVVKILNGPLGQVLASRLRGTDDATERLHWQIKTDMESVQRQLHEMSDNVQRLAASNTPSEPVGEESSSAVRRRRLGG